MTPALIVMATTVTVALPPFAVERAPGVLSQRVPDILAEGIDRAKCGAAMPPARMAKSVLTDFEQCSERSTCLSKVAQELSVDFVVDGHIVVIDSNFTVLLSVLDVHAGKVSSHLELHYDGKLSESALEDALGKHVSELCKAVNPGWKDPNAPTIDDLSFERPTDVKSNAPPDLPPPPPPAADATALGFEDLPSMTEDTPVKSGAGAAANPPAPLAANGAPHVIAPVAAPPAVIPPGVPPPAPTVAKPPPAAAAAASADPFAMLPGTEAPPIVVAPSAPPPVTPKIITVPPPLVMKTPNVKAPLPAVRRKVPWGAIVGGGALATVIVGAVLGAKSQSIWSSDHATTIDGIAQHTITQTQALQGNHYAVAADALFGVAAAAGVTAGVLIYVNGGLGLTGHF